MRPNRIRRSSNTLREAAPRFRDKCRGQPYFVRVIFFCRTAAGSLGGDSRQAAEAISEAQVVVNGRTVLTGADGRVTLDLAAGRVEITVIKDGFNPQTVVATVVAGREQTVDVALDKQTPIEEHVTVSATRTERGIDDQPMRVEVLDAEEIDEKLMMTPGDVVMMLNEMGGMRVQATSPSLGAASVRIQGMRGRYTRFLSDGLPLFGEQVSLGLMQILRWTWDARKSSRASRPLFMVRAR